MADLDWTGLSALVVAVSAAIAGLFTAARGLFGDRFRRDVEQSSALLTGYQGMVTSLQADVAIIRKELAAERDARRTEIAAERTAWNAERRELYGEIDKLRDSNESERDKLRAALTVERAAWHSEREDLHAQLASLREEVATMQPRAATDRTRKGDGPRRTPHRD